MKKLGLIIWIVIVLVLILLYWILFRNLVELIHTGQAPFWFDDLIRILYPRFEIEKHRFSKDFFLQKADQVMIRFCLVQILCWIVGYGLTKTSIVKQKIISFWHTKISVKQADYLRIIFYSGMIFFTYEWYNSLIILTKAAVFYKPLLLLQIFQPHFPSSQAILIIYILFLGSCVGVILNFRPILTSTLTTLIFVWMQALLYSFEKLDHTYATFTYCAMLMPFLIREQIKAVRMNKEQQEGWPLQLICLCIALAYLFSGLEKLLLSGFNWASAENFKSYIFLHQAPVGLFVAESNFLSILLPTIAIIFQLFFFIILFLHKLKIPILITGIGFHAGTYILLSVGWYISPWIFVYIFFIDWYKIFTSF